MSGVEPPSGRSTGIDLPPIVDADWLARARDLVVVCDVRTSMTGADPAEAFRERHLPGAVLVTLEGVLAAPADGVHGRHPLPTPSAFAEQLGRLGVDDDTPVVAYDDRGGAFAARLVWMLRVIDRPAALLDGGLEAWHGPVESGLSVTPAPVARRATAWPTAATADADEVAEQIRRGGVVVDSRDAPRYAGEVEPIDRVAGHVPGAINLPYVDNLGPGGRMRSTDELTARFAGAGVDGDAIVYCGSGVTACHNALAVEHAGLGRPAVFVGSWSGWSADPDRPVEVTTE